MAKANTFERNEEAIGNLLNSIEVQEAIREEVEQIARNAGEGFEAITTSVKFNTKQYKGKKRAVGYVKAVTDEARQACLVDNALLKAVR